MSHEIRTPLNAVLGSAQLLEKTNLGQVQHKYIQMIKTSGETLLGIINDILDFSKIEAGKLSLVNMPFSMDNLQN
jgi:signal transduction histidine kinase